MKKKIDIKRTNHMPQNPSDVLPRTSHQPMPAGANEESAVPMGGWLFGCAGGRVGGDKNCR